MRIVCHVTDFWLSLVPNTGPEKLLNRNNIIILGLWKRWPCKQDRTSKKRVRLEIGRTVRRLFHSFRCKGISSAISGSRWMERGNLKGRIARTWKLVDCWEWKAGSIRNDCNFPLWKLMNGVLFGLLGKRYQWSSRRRWPGGSQYWSPFQVCLQPVPLSSNLAPPLSGNVRHAWPGKWQPAAVSCCSISTHSIVLAVATSLFWDEKVLMLSLSLKHLDDFSLQCTTHTS